MSYTPSLTQSPVILTPGALELVNAGEPPRSVVAGISFPTSSAAAVARAGPPLHARTRPRGAATHCAARSPGEKWEGKGEVGGARGDMGVEGWASRVCFFYILVLSNWVYLDFVWACLLTEADQVARLRK